MPFLAAGTVKRVHIDKHAIARNRKGADDPVIKIQTSGGPIPCRRVTLYGASTMVQGRKPLSCGARVWIERRGLVFYSMAGEKVSSEKVQK